MKNKKKTFIELYVELSLVLFILCIIICILGAVYLTKYIDEIYTGSPEQEWSSSENTKF